MRVAGAVMVPACSRECLYWGGEAGRAAAVFTSQCSRSGVTMQLPSRSADLPRSGAIVTAVRQITAISGPTIPYQ